MDKFNSFIEEYDGAQYLSLPKFLKRRVDALKKIQLEHIDLQYQYNKRLQELELEFHKLYKPLYEKRAKIVSGEHEPTDDECQLPANIAENEFNGDQENANVEAMRAFNEQEETELKSKVKGLPGFWLGCLTSTYNFSDSIEEHDRQVLKYLKNIELSYEQKGESLTYKLEFFFDENPYFTNRVLTKTYYLKSKPDEKKPFMYEGFEVFKSEGCEIDWKEGKDITKKMVKIKQKNKKTGQIRVKDKLEEQDSFFYFFKPPQPAEGEEDKDDDELEAIMAVDFELGECIRQSVVPKAALYYSGYMMEDDDDDDDDVDDDDDDEDDEDSYDEDSDMEGSEDITSSFESSDSLVKKKNAS